MPFGSTMRVFHRFGMDSSLAFAVLAGLGAAALRCARAGRLAEHRPAILGVLLIAVVPRRHRGRAAEFRHVRRPRLRRRPLAQGSARRLQRHASAAGARIERARDCTAPPSTARRSATATGRSSPRPGASPLTRWATSLTLPASPCCAPGTCATCSSAKTPIAPDWSIRPGDTWEKVQERLKTAQGLRYVRTFDEVSPSHGDILSTKLTNPWTSASVAADRTHVYEILP